jgi:hypothetical protein
LLSIIESKELAKLSSSYGEAGRKEQRAWSKEHGAKSMELGAWSKEQRA